MSARVRLVLMAAAALALATIARADPPQKSEPTISDLNSRSVDVKTGAQPAGGAAKAMDNYRRFLELQQSDPKLRAEAMRRLGDLNLESGEFERMEKEVTQIDIQGGEAIKLYTTLLKAYPNYPRNDEVLYQLARAYETTGQNDQALSTLDRIVKTYPQSRQLDEVQFRRGELLFSAKRYPEAQKAYEVPIARGAQSAFYEQSLYKHGWALFKQSMNDESLVSFGLLLDRKLGTEGAHAVDIESMKRADRELVEDSMRVMSIMFSYADGSDALDQFAKEHGNRPYYHLLYTRLGDLYVDKQRFQDGANAYRAYVKRDPNSEYAPLLAMRAIEAYQKGGFSQLVLDGKHDFVERYHLGSPFWQGRERAQYPKVVEALKVNLRDVATYFHAQAQSTHKMDDYQEAARWYRDYLTSFPDDPDSAATNYLLAETLFEAHDFAAAAVEYERTAYNYPRNDKSATAGYAALVSYQKAQEQMQGPAQTAMRARAMEAGVKFATTFPEHPDSAGVLTRAAEDEFAAKDLPRASELAKMLLARQPPADANKQRIAWTIIAESQFSTGTYDQAESAFVKARELSGTDAKQKGDLTERLAADVYKQGEAKQQAGNATGAVEDYLRVAKVAPDSKIRATAEYDAATQLIILKQWDRAISVLEQYRHDFPKSELSGEVTRKLAVAYSEGNHPAEAAVEFEHIAADPKETPKVQHEALLASADLYSKANNSAKAIVMLEKYVAAHPPLPESVEAEQRLADYAAHAGDTAKELSWDRAIVQADAQAGAARTDRIHYLAGEAEIRLAVPARDAFRNVKLVLPLKKSLTVKKKALEVALADYKHALDYHIAGVTTVATFEMAELYRTLAKDVMASERPKNLSKEALEQYNSLLEEEVYPFEEQAIALHEANAARAKDGLYDEWVKKSYSTLAELKPARYAKTELSQDAVTTLK
jgi:tetratricopeptide (TPR) repeat protein